MIVVADASPLRYLVLIEHAHMLPALYGSVVVPPAVLAELDQQGTPVLVRTWISKKPDWVRAQAPQQLPPSLEGLLGAGEREAIALAEELSADALLMDDRDGRREAEKRNLVVLGTLRALADGAEHGFVDLPVALDRLRQTNFRASEQLSWRHCSFLFARSGIASAKEPTMTRRTGSGSARRPASWPSRFRNSSSSVFNYQGTRCC